MSKKSSAQAGEGKLESRFAALTSGLLARKGQAAPSNSPVVDPAEETEAFTLSDAVIPRKRDAADKGKGPGLSPFPIAPKPAPAPAAPSISLAARAPAKAAPPQPSPPPPQKRAEAPPPQPPAKPAKGAPAGAAPQPITVINERSYEAGYPDNPSTEEIAALEAEADEVASYFQNFGGDDAQAARDLFFDDEPARAPAPAPAPAGASAPSARDPLDDLDDGFDDPLPAPKAASGEASAAAPEVRASVHALLDARAFMRLSLGAAELDLSAEALIAEAIEEYLDARGVDSLGGEEFLKKLAAARAAPQEG